MPDTTEITRAARVAHFRRRIEDFLTALPRFAPNDEQRRALAETLYPEAFPHQHQDEGAGDGTS